jgi:hypothetical protein
MCNPPFYMDREDIMGSAEAKEFDPHAVSPAHPIGFAERLSLRPRFALELT